MPTNYLVGHVAKLKVLPHVNPQTSFISIPCVLPQGSFTNCFFNLDEFEIHMRSGNFRLCVHLGWVCLVCVYG